MKLDQCLVIGLSDPALIQTFWGREEASACLDNTSSPACFSFAAYEFAPVQNRSDLPEKINHPVSLHQRRLQAISY